jgi:hypothetical protein
MRGVYAVDWGTNKRRITGIAETAVLQLRTFALGDYTPLGDRSKEHVYRLLLARLTMDSSHAK